MTAYRFGLEFAGKDAAAASVGEAAGIELELDVSRSIEPDLGEHVFIAGDNLDVLRHLRTAYAQRVSMVYIDPPYNTGSDFVYRDRFELDRAAFLVATGQVDAHGGALVTNPSTAGRYHSAWLAMMYPRLSLYRELLREDGVLMCSIDDHEVHHLRVVLDEIFGEECFIAQVVVVTNRGGRDYLRIATGHEYLLVYGASPATPIAQVQRDCNLDLQDAVGPFELRELRNRNPRFHPGNRPNLHYPIYVCPTPDGQGLCAVSPVPAEGFTIGVVPRNSAGEGSVWRWGRPKLERGLCGEVPEVVARQRKDGAFNVYEKHRKTTTRPRALWDEPEFRTECGTSELRRLLGHPMFDHPKPVALIRRCIALGCPPDGIVLDGFAGSGTTMQAVLEQNAADGGRRRCVAIQLDESCPPGSLPHTHGFSTIPEIARARIGAAWREVAATSLRWFRARPIAPAWTPPPSSDAEAYWSALLSSERALAARPMNPWTLALEHGLGLDAELRHEGPWWVLHDATADLWLAVLGEEPSVDLPAWPDVPPGSAIAVPDRWLEPLAASAAEHGYRLRAIHRA